MAPRLGGKHDEAVQQLCGHSMLWKPEILRMTLLGSPKTIQMPGPVCTVWMPLPRYGGQVAAFALVYDTCNKMCLFVTV